MINKCVSENGKLLVDKGHVCDQCVEEKIKNRVVELRSIEYVFGEGMYGAGGKVWCVTW
jgi:hypothetical protein